MRRSHFKSWGIFFFFFLFRSRGSSHDNKYGNTVAFVPESPEVCPCELAASVYFHYSPGVSQRSSGGARSRLVASRVAGSLVFDELTVWKKNPPFVALPIHQIARTRGPVQVIKVNHRRSYLSRAIRMVCHVRVP
ncbi:hypothetical protein H4582DRAFT_1409795 [Lactarius indigo]|nr:hypothetical protein H4582DRAFT_1409795 [Lactarius indigo]